jgi:hypothetical protein
MQGPYPARYYSIRGFAMIPDYVAFNPRLQHENNSGVWAVPDQRPILLYEIQG